MPSPNRIDAKAREWIAEAWYDEEHDPDCVLCAVAQMRDIVRQHRGDPVFMRVLQILMDEDA